MSSVLTENIVLSRTRSQDLRNVRKLNCWGSELKDVSIVKKLVNVEVLSLSLNNISSLQCFGSCKFLQELYLRKNCISNLNELCYLQHLPYLRKLWLAENPCAEKTNYRMTVIRALPNLETLDNVPVSSEEVSKAQTLGDEIYDPSECNFQEASKSTPNRELEYDSNEETEENNRDDSYEKDEVKSPKLTEKAYSTPSPTQQQQLNKNQRFSYPEVGQQWIPPKDMSPPRPANVIPPTMLRSASLTDYSIYNGSNSSNTLSYQLATNHQKANIECSYETNSAYYTYDNSANGLHQKSTEAHNKSNNSSQQQKMLSKGGKNRNANILSAVLCLIKELDFASLEVVETAIHCRMEEMDN